MEEETSFVVVNGKLIPESVMRRWERGGGESGVPELDDESAGALDLACGTGVGIRRASPVFRGRGPSSERVSR